MAQNGFGIVTWPAGVPFFHAGVAGRSCRPNAAARSLLEGGTVLGLTAQAQRAALVVAGLGVSEKERCIRGGGGGGLKTV